MRTTELIYNKEQETIDQYMTRAAELLRGIIAGELDGLMSFKEQYDAIDYIFGIALKEVKEEYKYMYLYQKGLHEEMEDFYAYFSEVLVRRLPSYNDEESLKKNGKKYQFATFLRDLSGEVIRRTYADKHCVPLYVEIELQRLRTLRKSIAIELGIPEDDVTPRMIADRSSRSVSEQEVRAIFDITAKHQSIEKIVEDGMTTEKAFQGAENVETNAFDVLEYDVKKVFDGFFSRLTDIEKYFVLVQVGCSEERISMTREEIEMDKLFVSIVEKDAKFSKNVSIGKVVVERPGRSSVKGYESLIVEDVKHVNFTFVKYMKPKTEKKLLMLKNTLKMSDITGECGIAYFQEKWDELVEKYQ